MLFIIVCLLLLLLPHKLSVKCTWSNLCKVPFAWCFCTSHQHSPLLDMFPNLRMRNKMIRTWRFLQNIAYRWLFWTSTKWSYFQKGCPEHWRISPVKLACHVIILCCIWNNLNDDNDSIVSCELKGEYQPDSGLTLILKAHIYKNKVWVIWNNKTSSSSAFAPLFGRTTASCGNFRVQ